MIDTAQSKNGYIVNFVAAEPSAITMGAKLGMTTTGEADACISGAKKVGIFINSSIFILNLLEC